MPFSKLSADIGPALHNYPIGTKVFVYDFQTLEVREATIGMVKICLTRKQLDVSYMCDETGIGNGYIYHQAEVSLTEKEALEKVELIKADRKQKECEDLQ